MSIQNIPTTVFMGFLGSGKTTAILNLFEQKPADEYWAVLVNEFGKIGIDGKIFAARDIAIEEISGGCMCCTQGVPMRVSINRLLKRTKPDRLLIESSGVGHPSGLLKTLKSADFANVLNLKATIALLDPEKLLDPRIRGNMLFQDQLQCADILLANKIDRASATAMQAFDDCCDEHTQASIISHTQFAQIKMEWLDFPHIDRKPSNSRRITKVAEKIDWQTVSWRFPKDVQFSLSCLERFVAEHRVLRIKGFVKTKQGDFLLNAESGQVTFEVVEKLAESYIEVIGEKLDKTVLAKAIKYCSIN